MENLGCCAVLIAVVIMVVAAVLRSDWRERRSVDLIDGWASDNKLTILEKEPRRFGQGPVFWAGKHQTVYRIVVKGPKGGRRSGWIRCGGHWNGLHSDGLAVIWDDE
jgi:hypothetical protein